MAPSLEVWNIGIASVILLFIYGTTQSAFDMLNASLDDSNTTLSSKVGYEATSLYGFISIGGSFIVPWIQCLGYRILISGSALFHVPLYLAMILYLNEYAIYCGAAITGIAGGIIWVVLFDYVVSISQKKNIERNMSYFIFTYSFAALLGNLISYFNLDSPKKITSLSRIHIYSSCTAVTVIAALLGAFGLKKMPSLSPEASLSRDDREALLASDAEDYNSQEREPYSVTTSSSGTLLHRFSRFIVKPATMAQIVTSVVSGMYDAWVVIIFTCIRNTYTSRKLLPICGLIFGCCKVIFGGLWNKTTKTFGYRCITIVVTTVTLIWLFIILVMFPPLSIHELSDPSAALIPLGPGAVYLLGLFTGTSRTTMDLLKQISCGTCAVAEDVMEGFKPSVMFTVKSIIWSGSTAATLACAPFASFYILVGFSLAGLLFNHMLFEFILLKYFNAHDERPHIN